MTSSWCASLTMRSTPFWLKFVLRVDCALSFVDSCGVRLSAYAAILKNKTARITVVFIASSKLISIQVSTSQVSQIHFAREWAAVAQSPLAPSAPTPFVRFCNRAASTARSTMRRFQFIEAVICIVVIHDRVHSLIENVRLTAQVSDCLFVLRLPQVRASSPNQVESFSGFVCQDH